MSEALDFPYRGLSRRGKTPYRPFLDFSLIVILLLLYRVERRPKERGKVKSKFQLGQYIARNEEVNSSDQCHLCGKELKETNVELRVALTENLQIISADEVNSLPYGTDWSPRVGNECAKRFPKESLFEVVLI